MTVMAVSTKSVLRSKGALCVLSTFYLNAGVAHSVFRVHLKTKINMISVHANVPKQMSLNRLYGLYGHTSVFFSILERR